VTNIRSPRTSSAMPMPSIKWTEHDLLAEMAVDRRAAHGVAAWRIAPIRPVEDAVLEIELQIDRLRQPFEQYLDVEPVRRCLAAGHIDARAKDAPVPGVIRTLLGPVHLAAIGSTVIPTHQFDGSWRSPSPSPVWMSVSTCEPSRLARITRMPSRSDQ
jgi:hypothetical protein